MSRRGFVFIPAQAIYPGFGFTLPPNDDGSSGLITLPFPVNFFGTSRGSLYVNNNGNLTFDSPLSTYTPPPLSFLGRDIIAAYWADIDTGGVGLVSYGNSLIGGSAAFLATWAGVGYFSARTDKTNTVQLALLNRGSGDFDLSINYGLVEWEAGDFSGGSGGLGGSSARAGFSPATGPGAFELAGSGVNGGFLDSTPTGLVHRSFGTGVLGRYLFQFRSGVPLATP